VAANSQTSADSSNLPKAHVDDLQALERRIFREEA
jgi:hypothetical protein